MESSSRRIAFGASLQLPPVRIPLRTIESLKPGMVIRLDLPGDAMPEWRVGGQTLATAEAIRQGTRRAARMERRMRGERA